MDSGLEKENILTYLPPSHIYDTPSRKDGIDLETERRLRVYGCELIQEAGILLKWYPSSPPTRTHHHRRAACMCLIG